MIFYTVKNNAITRYVHPYSPQNLILIKACKFLYNYGFAKQQNPLAYGERVILSLHEDFNLLLKFKQQTS